MKTLTTVQDYLNCFEYFGIKASSVIIYERFEHGRICCLVINQRMKAIFKLSKIKKYIHDRKRFYDYVEIGIKL